MSKNGWKTAKKDLLVVVKWPLELVDDIQGVSKGAKISSLLPAALAIGGSYYFFGFPSMEKDAKELAMQYGATGLLYLAGQMILNAEKTQPDQ